MFKFARIAALTGAAALLTLAGPVPTLPAASVSAHIAPVSAHTAVTALAPVLVLRAVEDFVTVRYGETVTIDVAANDVMTKNGVPISSDWLGYRLEWTAPGSAYFVGQGLLHYTATSTIGGVNIFYRVCYASDCRTGFVAVTIIYPPLARP